MDRRRRFRVSRPASANVTDGVIELPAPAKINLFLHVVGRRADGYHDLQTVFQFVDLADRVRIALRADTRLRRTTATPGVAEADDLVMRAARLLRDEFGVPGEPDVASLLHVGGLFARGGAEGAEFAPDPDGLKQAAAEALDDLVAMRDREGARLAVDLRERLAGIRRAVDGAAELAPQRLERERTRLQAAVAELAGKGLDEDRLTREIALIADRWNVGEELVRARSHLEAFEEFLEAASDEPVGKRLGFLVQELQREVNTLGAKANDPGISRLVVEAKNEIERLREQVENVE